MHTSSPFSRDAETLIKSEMLIQLWHRGRITPEQWRRLVRHTLAKSDAAPDLLSGKQGTSLFAKLMLELIEHGHAKAEQLHGGSVLVASVPDSGNGAA